jgi:hypothetical protein
MNALTNMVNSTASGAIWEAGNIMSGDLWAIIYFFLGVTVVWTVIFIFKKFFGSK